MRGWKFGNAVEINAQFLMICLLRHAKWALLPHFHISTFSSPPCLKKFFHQRGAFVSQNAIHHNSFGMKRPGSDSDLFQ